MNKIITLQLEDKIWALEGFKVIIRAPKTALFDDYPYERQGRGNSSITNWSNNRLKPIIGDTDFTIFDGNGESPHGRTKLQNLRKSYDR